MSKIDQKWPQNRPKCVPGRSLASWLHLACLFCDCWCQNGFRNDLKIYQSSPRWFPGSAKCRTFLQTVALGASFGRLGPQSIYCFASVLNSFSSFPKNWGGEGVGSTISKITTPLSITSFFSTKTSDWHGAALLCNLDIYYVIYTRRKDGAKAPSLLDHLELRLPTSDAKAQTLWYPIADDKALNLRKPFSDAKIWIKFVDLDECMQNFPLHFDIQSQMLKPWIFDIRSQIS